MQNVTDYMSDANKKTWEIEGLAAGTPLRDIQTVGIIGGGTMGGGIAMNFATAGLEVKIVETKADALERGLGVIQKNYQRSADRGRFPQEEVGERMNRITGTLELDSLADCDLIIEAVFEDMDLKKTIFTKLDEVCKPGAILATNT